MTQDMSYLVQRAEQLYALVSRADHQAVLWSDEVELVRRAASAVRDIARRPVSVGILTHDGVGDLLGALFDHRGDPLHPNQAGGGYVASIEVFPSAGVRVTQENQVSVEYRTAAEAVELRDQFLAEIERVFTQAGIDCDALIEARRCASDLETLWTMVIDWARSVWYRCAPALRLGLAELAALRYAELTGREMLDQPTIPTSLKALHQAAQDADNRAKISQDELAVPTPGMPVRPRAGFALSPDALRRTLPLVRRVRIRLEVPAERLLPQFESEPADPARWERGDPAATDHAPRSDGFHVVSLPAMDPQLPSVLNCCLIASELTGVNASVLVPGSSRLLRVWTAVATTDQSRSAPDIALAVEAGSAGSDEMRRLREILRGLSDQDIVRLPAAPVPTQRSGGSESGSDPVELRRWVSRYVRERGRQHNERRLRAAVRDVEAAVRGIVGRLRHDGAAGSGEDTADRGELRELLGGVRQYLEALKAEARLHLADLDRVDQDGHTAHDRIEEAVAGIVYDWPQWTRLLDAADDSGHVPRRSEREHPGWPADTSVFEERFTRSVVELRSEVDRVVRRTLDAWLDGTRQRGEELRARLGEWWPRLGDSGVRDGHADAVDALLRVTRLAWLRDEVRGQDRPHIEPAEIRDSLALPLDRALPWSAEHPPEADHPAARNARHVTAVMRVRREIVCTLTRRAVADLARQLDAVATQVVARLTELGRCVPGPAAPLTIDAFLDAATGSRPALLAAQVADEIAAVLDDDRWSTLGGTAGRG